MKLLIVVVEDSRVENLVDALTGASLRVTRLASTGGWLRGGNTTLLIGLEEADRDQALALIQRGAPGTLVLTLPLERFERL